MVIISPSWTPPRSSPPLTHPTLPHFFLFLGNSPDTRNCEVCDCFMWFVKCQVIQSRRETLPRLSRWFHGMFKYAGFRGNQMLWSFTVSLFYYHRYQIFRWCYFLVVMVGLGHVSLKYTVKRRSTLLTMEPDRTLIINSQIFNLWGVGCWACACVWPVEACRIGVACWGLHRLQQSSGGAARTCASAGTCSL